MKVQLKFINTLSVGDFRWLIGILCLSIIALVFIGCTDSVSGQQEEEQQEESPVEEPVVRNPKKGFGITIRTDNGWVRKLNTLNVSWHYSWGSDLKDEEPDSIEFVPMVWGAWGDFSGVEGKVRNVKALADSGKVKYLLGFNEPDNKDQSNMSVDKAVAAWPKLEEAGLPLGSPAPVHADQQWLQDFMDQVQDKDLRVDFVTVHWYGGANAPAFLDYIDKIYEMYGLPIWITEFAVGDWNAGSVEDNKYSPEQVKTFMSQVLPVLDLKNFVKRYAWFSASTDNPALGTSALFNKSGGLTDLGRYYANHQ